MFDPGKRPRPPTSVTQLLEYRQGFFNPKVGKDEDGFTLRDAEALGWAVDLYHAHKHFEGHGLVRVDASRDIASSSEGRYGVLQAVYDFELKEHERAQARARGAFGRLVRAERQKLQALNAARAAREEAPTFQDSLSEEDLAAISMAHSIQQRAMAKAIKHGREALRIHGQLDTFGLLQLPSEYIDELEESKPRDAARKEMTCPAN